MMQQTWARDGSRRAIVVNRGARPDSWVTPPTSLSQWRPLPPMRPSTPPPGRHPVMSTSWANRDVDVNSPWVSYSPSPSSPLLSRSGPRAMHGVHRSQEPGALPPPRYHRTSTSTSSASATSQESSPPSASSPRPPGRWHSAGNLWSLRPTQPQPPQMPQHDQHRQHGQHLPAGLSSAFQDEPQLLEGLDVDLPALPAFGERTAAATLDPSGSPMSAAHELEPASTSTIDNLVALTQLLCVSDQRNEQNLAASNFRANRYDFMRQERPLTKRNIYCAFCKSNRELPSVYNSHRLHLKLPDGTLQVQCPILQGLRCENCGATGVYAHTKSHCPTNRQPSVALLLKRTPRRCDGSLRSLRK